jgi:PKD repeat protein
MKSSLIYKNRFAAGALIAVLALQLAAQAQNFEKQFVDGQIFVKFHDSYDPQIPVAADNTVKLQDALIFADAFSGQEVEEISRPFNINNDIKLLQTFLITFSEHASLDGLIKALEKMPEIEYAEKVPLYYPMYEPNDSLYHLVNGPFKWRWHLDRIKAAEAWDITQGSPEIKIAVVDNAVWADHPDLASQVVLQWDITNNTPNSSPPPTGNPVEWSHGTHCAGLVSAATDNEIGIAAIGFNTGMITIKAATVPHSLTHALQGVAFAIGNEADVVNMSFAGALYSQTWQNAINAGHEQGVLFVASAGSAGGSITYPAGYENVIAVGSTNEDDTKSVFSAFGAFIDVMAPGGYAYPGPGGLLSTTSVTSSFGYYDFYPGVSGSCALVSGLAGLIKSINPEITPGDLLAVLQATCDNIDAQNPGFEGLLGAGRINAFEAVKAVPFAPQADFKTPVTTILPGQAIDFSDLSAGIPASWNWTFEGGTPTTSVENNPEQITYNTTGSFSVSLTVQNAYGSQTITKPDYITVTSDPTPYLQFHASAANACIYDVISIEDASLYDPDTWNWDFSPATFMFVSGTHAGSQHPEIVFTQAGTYDVVFTATNANGTSTKVFEGYFSIGGLEIPFEEDFETGASAHLALGSNPKAYVRVNRRSAHEGEYGLHFTGSGAPEGWVGSSKGTTPQQAWEVNTDFHAFAAACKVDATAANSVYLSLDLRQTFSFGSKYSWFRVLVNDSIQVADTTGTLNFNPNSNSEPFDRKVFDLSSFAGTAFSVTLQSCCRVYDLVHEEGDNAFVDNIVISSSLFTLLPGDANCDFAVNALDVIVIVNFLLGVNPTPFCFENADINGNGLIEIDDLVETVNLIISQGTGSKVNPYSVAQAIQLQNANPLVVGFVKGYIVGAVKAGVTHVYSSDDIDFVPPFSSQTNVLIAGNAGETDFMNCVAVNLPFDTTLRSEVNLVANPGNLGKWLNVKGTLRTYFGIAGLRNFSGNPEDFELE